MLRRAGGRRTGDPTVILARLEVDVVKVNRRQEAIEILGGDAAQADDATRRRLLEARQQQLRQGKVAHVVGAKLRLETLEGRVGSGGATGGRVEWVVSRGRDAAGAN